MAQAIKTVYTYNLDGTKREFNVPFEYLARKFVRVTLIGKGRKILVLNQDYRFANKTTITTTQAWGSAQGYAYIEIRRYTSATERLIDYTDGSILRAYDLNISQLQTIHVAEEARDLTADTIGVNNDGDLDARGRRIVNLVDATNDRDAVTFGQVKSMSNGAWNARNQAEQFKNQAQGFRNEAEVSRNAAEAAKARAGQSALDAKASETNSKNSENAARASQTAASQSQQAAKTSENNAAAHVNSAKAQADRSKSEADRSNREAQSALDSKNVVVQNMQSYGSLPVGTVIATPINKAPAGFLKLDGSKFDRNTYDALFAYLGTDTLPDWRNRYLKGALNDGEVGVLKGWGLPARNGTARGAGGHNHTGTTSQAGNHTHTGATAAAGNHAHNGTTSTNGNHTHPLRHNNGGGPYTNRVIRGGTDGGYAGDGDFGAIIAAGNHNHTFNTNTTGNHAHTLTTNAAGNHTHTMTTTSVGDHTHVLEIPAMGTGAMDVDHVKVHWWIKAYGTTNAEQMAKVDAALQTIHSASAKVESYEARVKFIEQTTIPILMPDTGGSNPWVKIGRFHMDQYSGGISLRGTGVSGTNVNTAAAATPQGISWLGKVWAGNDNPRGSVSQLNFFGGPANSDMIINSLPLQGIAVDESESANGYYTLYLKVGAYGNHEMVFIDGPVKILSTFTAASGKNDAVITNPPANARFGWLTYTKPTQQFASTL